MDRERIKEEKPLSHTSSSRCWHVKPIAPFSVALLTDNNMRRGSGGRASSLSGGLGASAPKQLVLPQPEREESKDEG
jgi:hypothetical protein